MSSWCDDCQCLYDDPRGCPVCTGRAVPSGPDTWRSPTADEARERDHCVQALESANIPARRAAIDLLIAERAAARSAGIEHGAEEAVRRYLSASVAYSTEAVDALLELFADSESPEDTDWDAVIEQRVAAVLASASPVARASAAHRELVEAAQAYVDKHGSPLAPACQGPLEQRLRAALEGASGGVPLGADEQPPITGELNAENEYRTHVVQLRLCEGCLLGKGRECHTGRCALCWHDSPGPMPIMPELYLVVERDTSP